MRFKRPKIAEVDLGSNIVNMVDVLLLLLIFFMITTTFTRKGELGITLPEASAEAAQGSDRQIEIFISAQGEYSVNDRALVNDQLATIKAALQEVSGGDATLPLVITADARTPHQAVVRAMDAAGQLGFAHLSLTTRQSQSE